MLLETYLLQAAYFESPVCRSWQLCVCFFLNRCIFVFSSLLPPLPPRWHLRSLQFVSNIIVNDLKIISLDWNFFWKFLCLFFFFSPINVTFIPQTDIFTKSFKQYTCYKLLTLCFSLYLPWASLSLHPTKKTKQNASSSFKFLLQSFDVILFYPQTCFALWNLMELFAHFEIVPGEFSLAFS